MGLRIDYSLDIIPEFLIVFWWLLSFLVVPGEKKGGLLIRKETRFVNPSIRCIISKVRQSENEKWFIIPKNR